ncbi:MAG: prephenate dehydratase [Streptococcaceae bacterium]|jgi:prephenate dehydratase|nr:prephenate dehydratase [Streptococcaceae bacterium]
MKIATLGPVGSFSYNAATQAFPKADIMTKHSIRETIASYERGNEDYALIPIENSLEGSVNQATDALFHNSHASVVAEFILPIQQNLLVAQENITPIQILSHPQALAQTRNFLQANYPEATLEETDSTAQAAEYVANHPEKAIAAIAPLEAAETYHLLVAAANIQDNDDNHTRFWLLGHELPELFPLRIREKKTSLALTLPDNLPGALHKAISAFAWRGIDMTKIESRPLKTVLGQYFFIIDLADDPKIPYAIEELNALGVTTRLLGDYPIYLLA